MGRERRVAGLILGPMLRYVDASAATVWVETDAACEVEVLGHRARTFHVDGHHYAVVPVTGLEPGSSVEYQVHLDGELRWPAPDSPFAPCRIRTLPSEGSVRVAWGPVASPRRMRDRTRWTRSRIRWVWGLMPSTCSRAGSHNRTRRRCPGCCC